MKPLVSIIMPAYNAGKYLAEAIQSVINQTYPYWELLVIDDGSTDDTAVITNIYVCKDNRIRYIYQQNGKQGRARNNGISNANGNLIAFLDADDLWISNKLALQVEALIEQKVDLVFADSYLFTGNSFNKDCKVFSSPTGKVSGVDSLVKLLEYNYIPILTVLVSRLALLEVGLFTEKLEIQNTEDYHLWLKLLLSGKVFYGMHEVLAAYRLHPGSVTSNDKFNLKGVVQTKHDLIELYPAQKHLIIKELRVSILLSFNKYYSSKNTFDYEIIVKYLVLADAKKLKFFFTILKLINAHNLSIRLFYFIFNYFLI